MAEPNQGQLCIKSSPVKCSEWEYDYTYMHYKFSPQDGRYVFKWNFINFLMIDTICGQSKTFSPKNHESLRIRDFLATSQSTGFLLYTLNKKTFISSLVFDNASSTYEILNPTEIEDDCKEYGGNITLKFDDPTRGVIFMTRNSPGDIFVFFVMNEENRISFEQIIETEEREYCNHAFYTGDTVFFFRMAYGGGERPFESLKTLKRGENARTESHHFGPMPMMDRRDLMHRTQMPRFQCVWNKDGTFYLNVNIDPDQYFMSFKLDTLKWSEMTIPFAHFTEPRLYINDDDVLIVHNESKINGSANQKIETFRIPMKDPESLKNLSFFEVCKQNDFKRPDLPFVYHVQPTLQNNEN